jgi:hypothetical protein
LKKGYNMYETLLTLFFAFISIVVIALVIKNIRSPKKDVETYTCTKCSDTDCICHKSEEDL